MEEEREKKKKIEKAKRKTSWMFKVQDRKAYATGTGSKDVVPEAGRYNIDASLKRHTPHISFGTGFAQRPPLESYRRIAQDAEYFPKAVQSHLQAPITFNKQTARPQTHSKINPHEARFQL